MLDPSLDLSLLRVMIARNIYEAGIPLVDIKSLSKEAKIILEGYGEYFTTFSDAKICSFPHFVPWFLSTLHANWLNDEVEYYKNIFSNILKLEPIELKSVLSLLRYRNLSSNILKTMNMLDVYQEKVQQISAFDTAKLETLVQEFNNSSAKVDDYYTSDILEARKEEDGLTNLRPRLTGLYKVMGNWKRRFMLVVAGRDSGKTAFSISEACNALKNFTNSENVLYFNNEQANSDLLDRFYTCLLNKEMSDLETNLDKAKEDYVLSRGTRIKLFDIDNKNLDYIEQKCRQYNPGFIVIDQIDALLPAKDRENVLKYAELYGRLRKLSHRYAPLIGCTQAKLGGMVAAGSEIRQEWISGSSAHGSNVDKQANTDITIGIGRSNRDPWQCNFNIDRMKGSSRTGRFIGKLVPELSQIIDIGE